MQHVSLVIACLAEASGKQGVMERGSPQGWPRASHPGTLQTQKVLGFCSIDINDQGSICVH